jgi:hypothetical protein
MAKATNSAASWKRAAEGLLGNLDEALAIVRRVETALCKEADARNEWQYHYRNLPPHGTKRKPELIDAEKKAYADYCAAMDETRAARWAAADLLSRHERTTL